MNINDMVSREEIKKDQDRKAAGGDGDSRFWRIPDKKSTVRLLPRLENQVPYKTVYSHRYEGDGTVEKVFATCMKTFGNKNCPICKQSWAMHEGEDKAAADLGYQVRATPRFMYNCYIVNDPDKPENNGTIKILSVGKKLQDLILENFNAGDLGNAIFDPINGVDFEINRKKSGDNPKFPDYSSSRFVFKNYAVVQGGWDAIKDKLINIDDLIKEESPDELKEKFYFLGFSPSAPAPKVKKEEKKVEKKEEKKKEERKVEKPEEDDINIDELEGDNGNGDEPVDMENSTDPDEIDDIEEELDKL